MVGSTPLADVERALMERGISVARLCRRADIAESTWHRWKKRGMTPRDVNWERVQTALRDLLPDAALPPAA